MKTVVDDGTTAINAELHMREFPANVMPTGFIPAFGTHVGTYVWGYIVGPSAPNTALGTYIGPVFVARRSRPAQVRYVNDLGHTGTSQLRAWLNATDQTLHWADPQGSMCSDSVLPGQPPGGSCALHYSGPIPAVPHLHGGEVPPGLDGGPDAWFLSQAAADYAMHGHGFYSMDGNSGGN